MNDFILLTPIAAVLTAALTFVGKLLYRVIVAKYKAELAAKNATIETQATIIAKKDATIEGITKTTDVLIAAFKETIERQASIIKQLEAWIKQHEQTLAPRVARKSTQWKKSRRRRR